jgi:putative heme-binding domain-containing protein
MESYAGTLSDDNIWRVVAYIRSMSSGRAPQAAAGDPRRGKELFWGKGGCGSCHAVNGKGGRSGPDLSRAGRQRSAEFLRTSIVDPNLDITPGYQTITVVTRDGSTVTGIERGFDNFTAQIMDSSGRFYSFDKTELTSIRRDSRSPMPESYGRTLTSSEIDDLVSYLLTLRGAAK